VDELMARTIDRRAFVAGGAGAVLAAALAACGSDDGGTTTTGADGSPAPTGSFPVTVKHTFGETTIERAPRTVVSYGFNDHDTMLALGVVPAGLIQWIPEWKRGVGPWSERALGDARPELFDGQGVPFEQIAALSPDLVIAANLDLRASDYERLSELVPTVGPVRGHPAYGTPWDLLASQVGTALGKRSETQGLVDRARAGFTAARRDHPSFEGRTAMVVTPVEDGQMSIFADTDSRGNLVKELGFRQPAEVASLVGDQFYKYISPERFDLLEGDALIVLAYDAPTARKLDGMATYQQLDVVRRGSAVVISDMDEAMGLAASTVTSIPWALGGLVPRLARAVERA
jgi:iron-siderophore transport system substrate-binding protein